MLLDYSSDEPRVLLLNSHLMNLWNFSSSIHHVGPWSHVPQSSGYANQELILIHPQDTCNSDPGSSDIIKLVL